MKAVLKNYNQSPRKMRLIADMIRGKNLERALSELRHLPKRGGATFEKLLRSAYANARAQNSGVTLSLDTLYVKDVRVESGITLKRSRPRSRGMANPIRRRRSHIAVTLGERSSRAKTAGKGN